MKKTKITREEINIQLQEGLEAQIVLKRIGQQPPHLGNDVVVRAEIRLPADKRKNFSLLNDLQFGSKVCLAGLSLHANWGQYEELEDGRAYRYRIEEFSDPKWETAFQKAKNWAKEELSKLQQALAERKAALEAAEED
jgi:hypothetical protein